MLSSKLRKSKIENFKKSNRETVPLRRPPYNSDARRSMVFDDEPSYSHSSTMSPFGSFFGGMFG